MVVALQMIVEFLKLHFAVQRGQFQVLVTVKLTSRSSKSCFVN